jgi:hypothetical protein
VELLSHSLDQVLASEPVNRGVAAV